MRNNDRSSPEPTAGKLSAVMAATAVLTFTTLMTGYQLFFSSSPFA